MPITHSYGPIGRLGRWTATHFKLVAIAWAVLAIGLGVFAPKVEHALSGAGWEATGSESLQVRETVDREFGGLSSSALMVVVHSAGQDRDRPGVQGRRRRRPASAGGRPARDRGRRRRGRGSPSPVTATPRSSRPAPARARTRWCAPPTTSRRSCAALPADGVQVSLTGASGMWSDFNEANKTAMMKSELISWPVTLGILLLAFGSLVAAGLPLMLTILGLVASAGLAVPRHAGAGHLDLGDELRADVRARARHRLRAVHRHALPRRVLRDASCRPRTPSPRRWTPPARPSCSPA